MNVRRPFPLMLFLLALIVFGGCKKKPKTVPAAATQPPAISAPAPTVTKTAPAPTEAAAKPPTPAAPVDIKPKAKLKPKNATRKPQPKPPTVEPVKPPVEEPAVAKATPPPRITIQSGGSPESTGTVMPEMSHSEEAHRRQSTEQLMLSTEANIKSLKRVLTAEEKSLLQQVQLFLTQSREATDNQDLVRAHNLAMKAHLLSDELLR